MEYSLQVNTPGENERTYVVWLGETLQKMPEPIQKRWVRKRIETEYGFPIKNPTQKRYMWEPYFSRTELTITVDDEYRWDVTVAKSKLKGYQ